jgi:membrane protease YdiL (CAAX protease family)
LSPLLLENSKRSSPMSRAAVTLVDEMPLIRRFPLASFFAMVYAASLMALVIVGLPPLPGAPGHPPVAPLLVFPFMVVTVAAVGVCLTGLLGGRGAVGRLLRGIRCWRVGRAIWAALLIPPACILASLFLLRFVASSAYAPHMFPIGILFGLVAGFFEELGWTGYAYPKMAQRQGPLVGALVLGLLWGLWHLPVVDSLGAAAPHGRHWLVFFGAFVMVLTALRVLIAWIYNTSRSLLMAQLMHASSTGFLVVLGAPHVTATQEVTWYALYGLMLAIVAAVLWRVTEVGAVRRDFALPTTARTL